ncbi:hypothetical protein [Paenibacillus sacheonensis]|uniref:Uncharacterized protein n=1 Tax=Paenibacillus sacheonensis TaxID=742054 RepID=A0A7X4YTA9_9BACL|nr:hypothetical protein [Paenibacillus sacheonensis]MBM7565767.1 hypothetical protein [Paenibacillus sacheonensis]NBC72177.1 hypothetical protein [Paenibacillus sacheonensis]
MNNEARWVTGKITSKVPAKDSRGNALYWKDSEKKYLTTDVTAYLAYTYEITETEKLKIAFEGSGQASYPYSVWGAGDGVIKNTGSGFGDSARGYIYKGPNAFNFRYNASNTGDTRELILHDNGIEIASVKGDIHLIGDAVHINAVKGGIQLLHSLGSKIVIDESGENIKLEHSNGSVLEITNEGLFADIDGDINLNATGDIKLSGARIDLN